ncbi:MAG: hypothetical protein K2K60_03095 [Clostridia bacterium]|nr:hypothetical protein [Clostridia bacterium]
MIKEHNINDDKNFKPFRGLKNKTFSDIIDGATITTIILMLVSAAMLYLTEITVNMDMSWKDFGYEAVILYIFTVSINFMARSVAKRKGRETKEHIEAFALVKRQEDEIIDKGLRGKEREYCRKWEEAELYDTRKIILASAQIDIEKFESTYLQYSNKELKAKQAEFNLTDYQLKVIKKAKRVKRLKYDEKYLSATLKTGRRVSPNGDINTAKYERFRTIKYLITAFAGVCVSVSMVLNVITNPTLGTVVMCVIKLITILVSAVAGMIGGYRLTADMETAELQRKAVEQKKYIAWCEEN